LIFIDLSDAGVGQVDVQIIDPKGKANSVPLRVRQNEDDESKYKCEYEPQLQGPHQVQVSFAGKPVPHSPFNVKVNPPCDARKVRALGRGIQPTGIRVNEIADFKVLTDGAGAGQPEVKVLGPSGQPEKVNIRKMPDGFTYECDYKPLKEGRYVVVVGFGGEEIFQSPFEVQVGPHKESKLVAYGPGLQGGVVGYPAKFTIDTNGETGTLGFSVEGPSYAKIECKDNGDGSAEVVYHPTAPGEYAVHITCDGDDIPKSPYMPIILPKTDYYPENVVSSGPGLAPKGVVIAKPTEFNVDTRKAGKAPLDVSVMNNDDYKNLEVKLTDNKDGTFKAQYKPDKLGKHTVQVNYGGVATTKSPYSVQVGGVADPSKV
jgi:filamin